MSKRKEVAGLNIALLDILTGALGAVIILYVAVPKGSETKREVASRATISVLEKEKTDLHAEIRSKEQKIKDLQKIVMDVQAERDQLKTQGDIQQKEIESLKDKTSQLAPPGESDKETKEDFRGKGLPVDVGFKFKGKKIVFIIDVSGSMYREDRIGQVKAGLKMLITSMPADYELDVLYFPGKGRNYYGQLWGNFKSLDSYNKTEVYRFLLKLRPGGFTPTRKVVLDALKNYEGASDIVLLSDGAPTHGNTNKNADISKILMEVANQNKNNVRINTIGVGSSFLKNTGSKAHVFLQELARDHGGFFYGF
ncbi:unnamed protein product [Chrysoparadoxa australica]